MTEAQALLAWVVSLRATQSNCSRQARSWIEHMVTQNLMVIAELEKAEQERQKGDHEKVIGVHGNVI